MEPEKNKTQKKIFCIIAAAALAAAVMIALWLNGHFLPHWVVWNEVAEKAVLSDHAENRDLPVQEVDISLSGRRLTVSSTVGEVLYQTKKSWYVSAVRAADLDRDGGEEIIFLLWKRGNYGPAMPSWENHNDIGFSEHIFIYQLRAGRIVSKWGSAGLGKGVADISVVENPHRAGDALELTYQDGTKARAEWVEFGLSEVEETAAEEITSGVSGRISFCAVGDNLISAAINADCYDRERDIFDYSPLYENVADWISSYDLAAVNQETVFVSDYSKRSGYPRFATPDPDGGALADAGFDIVTCATNHAWDQGSEGVTDTLAFWKKYPQITLLGIHDSEEDYRSTDYLEKNGIRLALFNYTFGLNGIHLPDGEYYRIDLLKNADKLMADVRGAEKSADFTVCFIHQGEEYARNPSEEQKKLARELAECGADLIIFTHSHSVEPMDTVASEDGNSALVYYGLGNFVSSQNDLSTVMEGAASLTIEKKDGKTEIVSSRLVPLVNHEEHGSVRVYRLADYTDELAAENLYSREGRKLTLDYLRSLWYSHVSG